MAIPETQLDTWAHQGSITQSSETYAAVKRSLEASDAAYAGRSKKIYLQGSYANATNIYADSDVDVVIQLDDCYYYDETDLPEAMRTARAANRVAADYKFSDFQRDVLAQLRGSFNGVTPGSKAIFISGSNSRRDADVLVAVTFKKFFVPAGKTAVHFWEGVCFFAPDGTRIVNYPQIHSANCTSKHQATSQWFKPTVRIFKNLRNRALSEGLIAEGSAPSYFLEGMLYNVPDDNFGGSYGATVANALRWLLECDRDKLVCANRRFRLLHPSSLGTWRTPQFEAFLSTAVSMWNGW